MIPKSFRNIRELIRSVKKEERLIIELFEKRNQRVTWDQASQLLLSEKPNENPDERLTYLLDRSVILRSGDFIELEDRFKEFFEELLEVNSEINTSFISASVEVINDNIQYYLNEGSEHKRELPLTKVKREFRKIGKAIIRNVIDLRRNIDSAYKTEGNYKNKKIKLESYNQKSNDIERLITITEKMAFESNQIFFTTARDEEMNRILREMKFNLHQAHNSLIEIQSQIIDYLNQIQKQSSFLEKLRILKYLRDQHELNTNKTNFTDVVASIKVVAFETRPSYPLQVSLDYLQTDEPQEILKRVRAKLKSAVSPPKASAAEAFTSEELSATDKTIRKIDIEAIKNQFTASGSKNLFSFLMSYKSKDEMDFERRILLYCQIISGYAEELVITNEYHRYESLEYLIIKPR